MAPAYIANGKPGPYEEAKRSLAVAIYDPAVTVRLWFWSET